MLPAWHPPRRRVAGEITGGAVGLDERAGRVVAGSLVRRVGRTGQLEESQRAAVLRLVDIAHLATQHLVGVGRVRIRKRGCAARIEECRGLVGQGRGIFMAIACVDQLRGDRVRIEKVLVLGIDREVGEAVRAGRIRSVQGIVVHPRDHPRGFRASSCAVPTRGLARGASRG
jgi:hypothetical protein